MAVNSDAGVAYQLFIDPTLNTFGPVALGVYENMWLICVQGVSQFHLEFPVRKGTEVFIQAGGAANICLFFDDSFQLPD